MCPPMCCGHNMIRCSRREWSDRLEHYFTDVALHSAFDAGHFTPLECPEQFTELILIRARPSEDARGRDV